LLTSCLFNEEVIDQVKSAARPKFLNIGLGLAELLLNTIADRETSSPHIEQLLLTMLQNPNFIKILVKNYQTQKGVLFNSASAVRNALLKVI